MLSGLLNKNDCASCRFCCSFRRTSLWEVPIFTKENIDAINADTLLNSDALLITEKEGLTCAVYDLAGDYKTDDPNEEVPCPYLGEKGCVLSEDEKPFDCKIWTLHVMNKDNEIVIALTPTCPIINKTDFETVKKYVDDNLGNLIIGYAKDHPYLIKEYHPDFPVL